MLLHRPDTKSRRHRRSTRAADGTSSSSLTPRQGNYKHLTFCEGRREKQRTRQSNGAERGRGAATRARTCQCPTGIVSFLHTIQRLICLFNTSSGCAVLSRGSGERYTNWESPSQFILGGLQLTFKCGLSTNQNARWQGPLVVP
jgi:hypothetical protein